MAHSGVGGGKKELSPLSPSLEMKNLPGRACTATPPAAPAWSTGQLTVNDITSLSLSLLLCVCVCVRAQMTGKKELSNGQRLLCGATAGAVAIVCCFPLDVLRTRMLTKGGEVSSNPLFLSPSLSLSLSFLREKLHFQREVERGGQMMKKYEG